jgi:DNA adenine methylase
LGEISKREFEYITPIYKVDKVEKMVYGIVLEPNVVDAQGDIIAEEEIKKTAHKFMEDYQKLGYQHEEFNKKLKIMESYLAPQELSINNAIVRKGTWLMAVRVLDDDIWKEVQDGKITGFSIGGKGIRVRRE